MNREERREWDRAARSVLGGYPLYVLQDCKFYDYVQTIAFRRQLDILLERDGQKGDRIKILRDMVKRYGITITDLQGGDEE